MENYILISQNEKKPLLQTDKNENVNNLQPNSHNIDRITSKRKLEFGKLNGNQLETIKNEIIPLEYWKNLKAGREREFTGKVYDTSIIKRVYPDEVYGWEHSKTTQVLEKIAKNDLWEEYAIPPVLLAYSPEKTTNNERNCQYAIKYGHHRLNAAIATHSSFPAMVVSIWEKDENGSYVGYKGQPNVCFDPNLPTNWNPKKIPQREYVMEDIRKRSVWGTPELQITLKAEDKLDWSLKNISQILHDKGELPQNFFMQGNGDILQIRFSLCGAAIKGSHEIIDRKIILNVSDVNSSDWRELLTDTTPIRKILQLRNNSEKLPILNIQIQQNKYCFINEGLD